jgi:hypothetical protein
MSNIDPLDLKPIGMSVGDGFSARMSFPAASNFILPNRPCGNLSIPPLPLLQ